MKTSMHWCQLSDLLNEDYFFISYYLRYIEMTIKQNTGIEMLNSLHRSRRFEYPWCMLQTKEDKEMVVLDAGGGASSFPFLLSGRFKEVFVVDVDKEALHNIEVIQQKIPQYMNVKPWEDSILDLEFNDEVFDISYCISVLEHGSGRLNQNVRPAIKELLRVSKNRLLVTMDVGPQKGPNGPLGMQELYDLSGYYDFIVPEKPIDCFRTSMDGLSFSVACLCFDIEYS